MAAIPHTLNIKRITRVKGHNMTGEYNEDVTQDTGRHKRTLKTKSLKYCTKPSKKEHIPNILWGSVRMNSLEIKLQKHHRPCCGTWPIKFKFHL